MLAVGMSPVQPVPGDKERVFSPGRVKGYSCHSARQDPVCAEVRCVCVCVCVCVCARVCARTHRRVYVWSQ